jgi:hypothetical protein
MPESDSYRIWEDPRNLELIGGAWWLVARRGKQIVGTWLVPIEAIDSSPIARRRVRALPYSSPRLTDSDPRRRREVWRELLRWVQTHCTGLEVPLAPDFADLGAVCEIGGFLEARHTHVIDSHESYRATQNATVRNHIKKASTCVRTVWHRDVSTFNFGASVVGAPADHVLVRKRLSAALAGRGQCEIVEAVHEDGAVGGVVVASSAGYAIIMHSWFDRRCGIRGIPSLLIDEVVTQIANRDDQSIIDLEGSVIASVDSFMDGTGARSAPYAIAYWYRERERLWERLQLSMDIPGRALP